VGYGEAETRCRVTSALEGGPRGLDAAGCAVTASATRDGAGRFRLRLAIGRTVRILLISAGGTIAAGAFTAT
jgi:hypothetical protein